jgi:hypothetical protein
MSSWNSGWTRSWGICLVLACGRAADLVTQTPTPRREPTEPVLSDGDKLRVLAAWFDMWDRPETDRQRILDDPRNPGRNDVQRDLLRIALALDARSEAVTQALSELEEAVGGLPFFEVVLDDYGVGGRMVAQSAVIQLIHDKQESPEEER